MKDIYQIVGRNIRAKRHQLDLTLEQLSELCGLHPSYIGQIERNSKKASLETVVALAEALSVPVCELLSGVDVSHKDPAAEQLELLVRSHGPAKRKLILAFVRGLSIALKDQK